MPSSQKPARWISIGTRRSPQPRSTPPQTIWIPSKTWKAAATGSSSATISMTPASSV
jgi:hypothetical protein